MTVGFLAILYRDKNIWKSVPEAQRVKVPNSQQKIWVQKPAPAWHLHLKKWEKVAVRQNQH